MLKHILLFQLQISVEFSNARVTIDNSENLSYLEPQQNGEINYGK